MRIIVDLGAVLLLLAILLIGGIFAGTAILEKVILFLFGPFKIGGIILVIFGNVKKCAVGKYPKSEKLGGAGQAACCACTHSRYFTGGIPSGLRV